MIANCLQFDGGDVCTSTGVPGCPSTGFTVSCWLYRSGESATNAYIFAATVNPKVQLRIGTTGVLTLAYMDATNATKALTGPTLEVGTIYHLVVTFVPNGLGTRNEVTWRLNDVVTTSGANGSIYAGTSACAVIGATTNTGTQGWIGKISHLCFFDGVLTDAQILQLARVPMSYRYDAALLERLIEGYPLDEPDGVQTITGVKHGTLYSFVKGSTTAVQPTDPTASTMVLPFTPTVPPAVLIRRAV